LSGVARYLFVPMAEAVVFAMLASYLLSRTVVPTMAKYLLHEHDDAQEAKKRTSRNPLVRFQLGFESGFTKMRLGYLRILTLCVDHARLFLVLFAVFAIGSVALLTPPLGRTSFRVSMRGSSRSTCGRRPAHALRRRRCSAITSTGPFDNTSPPKNWSPLSTTSGYHIQA